MSAIDISFLSKTQKKRRSCCHVVYLFFVTVCHIRCFVAHYRSFGFVTKNQIKETYGLQLAGGRLQITVLSMPLINPYLIETSILICLSFLGGGEGWPVWCNQCSWLYRFFAHFFLQVVHSKSTIGWVFKVVNAKQFWGHSNQHTHMKFRF